MRMNVITNKATDDAGRRSRKKTELWYVERWYWFESMYIIQVVSIPY